MLWKRRRRIAIERTLNGRHIRLRQVRAEVAQRLALATGVGPRQLLHRSGHHGELPGDQVEQQHAQAVEIALHRRALAAEDLGRKIEGRADQPVGARQLFTGAKIHQHESAAALAHDVLGLDVAVQKTGAVHGRHRRGQIQPDERRFTRAERPAGLHDLFERLAAHELHPEADAVVVLLGAVHLHDVRMTDPRQAARLFENPAVGLRVIAVVVQQLQRDFAVQSRVPRPVDLA